MLKSPAKLNLGLQIVGRRTDGYHLLESLFWPLNFYDEVEIKPASVSSVKLQWALDAPVPFPDLLQDSENLVGKLIGGEFGWKPSTPKRISIRKRIPIGGGLGGISSNVGTVLKWFVQERELSYQDAAELSKKAGADISFFLDPVPTWVTGVGEQLSQLKVDKALSDDLCFLLIFFPKGTPTPALFQAFRESQRGFSKSFGFPTHQKLSRLDFESFCQGITNDLEKMAVEHYPLIGAALDLLRRTGSVYSGLSGTGSTCFGVYFSPDQAEKGAKVLSNFCRDHQCRSVFSSSFKQLG